MSKTEDCLATLGQDPGLRDKMIGLCRIAEKALSRPDFDVREQVTGPILDALHRDVGPLQKRLKSGLTFHFTYSGRIARDFVMSGEDPDHVWEPQTTKLLLHFAERARTVVIAGAYAGDQALLVAQRLARAGGVCHCFEPDRKQLALLQRNAESNRLAGNMVLNGIALWDTDNASLRLVGDAELGRPEEASPADSGEVVATTTVDVYGAQQKLNSIDVLMLDVEGGEYAILCGAAHYLSQPTGKAPHVVFEIHRAFVDWSDGLENTTIGRLLREYGYKLYAIRDYQSNVDMAGLPIELVDVRDIYLEGPPHGFNVLAVKDESVVTDPVFRIRRGVSPKLLRHRDPSLHQPL